jgi:hypothetical protein
MCRSNVTYDDVPRSLECAQPECVNELCSADCVRQILLVCKYKQRHSGRLWALNDVLVKLGLCLVHAVADGIHNKYDDISVLHVCSRVSEFTESLTHLATDSGTIVASDGSYLLHRRPIL